MPNEVALPDNKLPAVLAEAKTLEQDCNFGKLMHHWAYYGPLVAALAEQQAAENERLKSRVDSQKETIEEMQASRFSPMGDNHHNAALCPHCGEPLRKALDKLAEIVKRCDRVVGSGSPFTALANDILELSRVKP